MIIRWERGGSDGFSRIESVDNLAVWANAEGMEIVVDVDVDLLQEARQLAAKGNRTLSAVVEDALREELARIMGPQHDVKSPISSEGGGAMPASDP
jgi:hypothetical protein